MLVKNYIHSSLVYHPRILKFERYDNIAIHPQGCPERSMLLIVRVHFNLIVPRESVHKRHPFKPTSIVYHDICDWKGELIFRTCLI